ncbi:DUF1244 domain-containing protein [Limimaricola litoreus]|uniref:DUF1244 domain-containing protein n=1 Tax=Limimaricola litoreus TaxID=2955316 RepID=A0A9X2JS86_9RHOB|nr:DUF1244 domain-containing protein [Limimaricola litoreus]MCP1169471.1 DUF1244 domain-containing protein [Limimaricola litoreus]
MSKLDEIDEATRTEIEAAAFRRLRKHLMEERPEVQNIDLMNLAGFCRNCLARWTQEEAAARGHEMTKDEAREAYYGMPYDQWREKHQREASEQTRAAFDAAQKHEASEG